MISRRSAVEIGGNGFNDGVLMIEQRAFQGAKSVDPVAIRTNFSPERGALGV